MVVVVSRSCSSTSLLLLVVLVAAAPAVAPFSAIRECNKTPPPAEKLGLKPEATQRGHVRHLRKLKVCHSEDREPEGPLE